MRTILCSVAFVLWAVPPCDGGKDGPDRGGLDQPCYTDGTCDAPLVCDADVCTPSQDCELGTTQPCTCSDGATGVQGCGLSGAWANCVCQVCGDGSADAPEVCDDGAANGTYGHCLADCSGPGPFCGDGTVTSPEACDDGAANGTYDHCPADCSGPGPHCGDGSVTPPEVCDDGAANGTYGHCLADCSGPGPSCGDSTVTSPEACDDGAANGTYDHCLADCSGPGPHCGDGSVHAQEVCDDGVNVGDPCREDCGQDLSTCGDGVLDTGEQCDDATQNADGVPDACRRDCQNAACGDGVSDTGEVCDGQILSGSACADYGQGHLGGTLQCNATCDDYDTSLCVDPATCGNSALDPGEDCDGATMSATDCVDATGPPWLTPVGLDRLGERMAQQLENTSTLSTIAETSNTFGVCTSECVQMTWCPGGCDITMTLTQVQHSLEATGLQLSFEVELEPAFGARIEIEIFGLGLIDTTCGFAADDVVPSATATALVETYLDPVTREQRVRVASTQVSLASVELSYIGCGIVGTYLNTLMDYINDINLWVETIVHSQLSDDINNQLVAPNTADAADQLVDWDHVESFCAGCSLPGRFVSGALGCDDNRCGFDLSLCAPPTCGDGVAQGIEACDGNDLRGANCMSRGNYSGGVLGCNAACGMDESLCTPPAGCGNGVLDAGEQCDATQLGGLSCAIIGPYQGGPLRCAGDCTLDPAHCVPY